MNRNERQKIMKNIKSRQQDYLSIITDNPQTKSFDKRFRNLYVKIRALLRKQYASENFIQSIPNIARIIFGLSEDMRRLCITQYLFKEELNIVNNCLKYTMDKLRESKYKGKVKYYGEILLNCYLDLFISYTTLKTPKEIEAKPIYLINPGTGKNLELDLLFEDFKIAIEFQGEEHYRKEKYKKRDIFKIEECRRRGRVLVPINISQLNHKELSVVILNSVKDYIGIHEVLCGNIPLHSVHSVKKDEVGNFLRMTQRMYSAIQLFKDTFNWLDDLSKKYILDMHKKNPISSTQPAPRPYGTNEDIDIEYIYKNIKLLKSRKLNKKK